ncbi:MAG: hypothetical protein RL172_3070 [Bacteroidota bacterium]
MKNKFTLTILLLCLATAVICQNKLNSYPAAKATIYLDFDGEFINSPVWNTGNAFTCKPAGFTNTEITEVFNRVAEDYRPFNINITTDEAIFIAAPADQRIRVIITPTSSWFAGVGGVGYLGSFTWGDDTPCFVFCDRLGGNNPKMVAEACAHESGHSLGLSHQSKYDESCHLTASYNNGTGTGETSWAPIMGNSYYRNMSGWSNGPTPFGCANVQDNLSIITSRNGFGYRADDYSDDIAAASPIGNPFNININGIISTSADKDVFKFTLDYNSNFRLDALPFAVNSQNNEGGNLDIKLSLYDANQQLLYVSNPDNSMSAVIDTILQSGTYYVMVDGTGNTNTSDYGSLGSYSLKGLPGVLRICDATLNGSVINNQHQLNWSLVCYESIGAITLEQSADGLQYKSIVTPTQGQNSYSYSPYLRNDLYYRVKIASASGKIVYSNTVLLKGVSNGSTRFTVSTYTQGSIRITAYENYSYQLVDLNGNRIAAAAGKAGIHQIDISNKPAGMYLLQLISNHNRQTEKIIKE